MNEINNVMQELLKKHKITMSESVLEYQSGTEKLSNSTIDKIMVRNHKIEKLYVQKSLTNCFPYLLFFCAVDYFVYLASPFAGIFVAAMTAIPFIIFCLYYALKRSGKISVSLVALSLGKEIELCESLTTEEKAKQSIDEYNGMCLFLNECLGIVSEK